jgi:hypothetical protein
MEDPENIRQTIRHYRYLLTLYSTTSSQEQVLKLLANAQAQLSFAEAEALPARVADG